MMMSPGPETSFVIFLLIKWKLPEMLGEEKRNKYDAVTFVRTEAEGR